MCSLCLTSSLSRLLQLFSPWHKVSYSIFCCLWQKRIFQRKSVRNVSEITNTVDIDFPPLAMVLAAACRTVNNLILNLNFSAEVRIVGFSLPFFWISCGWAWLTSAPRIDTSKLWKLLQQRWLLQVKKSGSVCLSGSRAPLLSLNLNRTMYVNIFTGGKTRFLLGAAAFHWGRAEECLLPKVFLEVFLKVFFCNKILPFEF